MSADVQPQPPSGAAAVTSDPNKKPPTMRDDEDAPSGERTTLMRRLRSRVPWFHSSYLGDYAVVIAMAIGATILSSSAPNVDSATLALASATHDPDFAYPYAKSTVPSWAAGVLAYATPVMAFEVAQVPAKAVSAKLRTLGALKVGRSSSGVSALASFVDWSATHDLHAAVLGLVEDAALTALVTNGAKAYAGRPRPHYFARKNVSVAEEKEARRSFPSGHSSTVFSGLTFLSLYLAGKLGLFRSGGGEMWKLLACGAPLGGAFLVAITRTRDHHHNYDDITAGSFIGMICAAACYFCCFHSLASPLSALPLLRAKRGLWSGLSGKHRDEDVRLADVESGLGAGSR